MKIIDDIWFTGFQGIVGILIGEDDVTHERKAYVGIVSGKGLWKDVNAIAENGCPLTPEVAMKIAGLLNPSNDKKKVERLREAGDQMSNVLFNWSQREDSFTPAERKLMKDLQEQWDAARR